MEELPTEELLTDNKPVEELPTDNKIEELPTDNKIEELPVEELPDLKLKSEDVAKIEKLNSERILSFWDKYKYHLFALVFVALVYISYIYFSKNSFEFPLNNVNKVPFYDTVEKIKPILSNLGQSSSLLNSVPPPLSTPSIASSVASSIASSSIPSK